MTRAASGERYSPQIFGRGNAALSSRVTDQPALGQQDRGRAARRPAADDHDVDHDLARTAQNRKYGQWCTTSTPSSPARSQSPLTSTGVYERLTDSGPS